MYKRILIAIDGSDTSDRALREAIGLAKDQQAMLRIVYAIDEISINTEPEFVNPEDIAAIWAKSGIEILDKAKNLAHTEGIHAETRLIEIDELGVWIAGAILEDAKTWSADLVVAGTHGRRGLTHLFLGSVAEDIVRHCPVPVLLVRTR